jgi:uncharacterized membrane protein
VSWYEFLKTIHVLAAAAWVGTAISSEILGRMVAKAIAAGDTPKMISYVEDQETLGKSLYAPASGLVLLTGILMVLDAGLGFTDTWILIGLIIFAISTVVGIVYFTPETPKLLAALREGRQNDSDFQARVRRITTISRIDTLLLIAVVANMVIKPGA